MKRVEVAIAIVCKDEKVLICRRRVQDHLGGLWEFPGGKIEPGESPEDCLIRELREEVRIEVEVLTAFEVIEHDYSDRHVRLHPYLCAHKSGQAVAVGCESVQWVKPMALREYEFPPANSRLIEEVVRLTAC